MINNAVSLDIFYFQNLILTKQKSPLGTLVTLVTVDIQSLVTVVTLVTLVTLVT